MSTPTVLIVFEEGGAATAIGRVRSQAVVADVVEVAIAEARARAEIVPSSMIEQHIRQLEEVRAKLHPFAESIARAVRAKRPTNF